MSESIRTTVVGSYSVPDWYPILQKAVEDGRLKPVDFGEAKAIASRSAIKDQEAAGIDVISDGELFRRDNNRFGPPNAMINYFTAKIPGFSDELRMKKGITPVAPEAALPAPVVVSRITPAPLGLAEELKFLREYSDRKVKIAMTGPHMLARVAFDEYYNDTRAMAFDLAAVINEEFKRLDEAGCDWIQLDEPVLWFLARDQDWGIEAINACFDGIRNSGKALHVCQGNYNEDPSAHQGIRIFPSEFRNILPVLQKTDVDLVLMSLASLGEEDLSMLADFPEDRMLGAGCIDVQTHEIEKPAVVAARLESVLKYIPAERVFANPDCGLNHLPRDVAFGKLQSLVRGARMVTGSTALGAAR